MLLVDRVLNWPLLLPTIGSGTSLELTRHLRHNLEGARIVTAQAVYERVLGSVVDYREISPIPPVSSPIWIEYEAVNGDQHGVLAGFEGDETGGKWELQTFMNGGGLHQAMWPGVALVVNTSAGFTVREETILMTQPWVDKLPGLAGDLHFGVAMFAVALLAAHNIETLWVDPPLPAKRSRRTRDNRPLVRYEEIVVRPAPGEQNRSVAQDSGLQHAEHTVRGHFAHYGRCCGTAHEPKGKLFGLHERRLWIDEHSAGAPELGSVVSDIRVGDTLQ
jgi:hypothetical protein